MVSFPQAIDFTALLTALSGNGQVKLGDESTVSVAAAIIFDLDGMGVQTLARSKGEISYDLDGDGLADRTSWIGSTEGILFLDRDGSGTLNDLAEKNFLGDLAGARSNLAGLKAFDSDDDGALAATDAKFADFKIWRDKNGNGFSDNGEVSSLTTLGIKSISLSGAPFVGPNLVDDVAIITKGSYLKTNGSTMDLLDAALTFTSAPKDGLPDLTAHNLVFSHKASKYRISARSGQLFVTGKYVSGTIDSRAGGLGGLSETSFRNLSVGMLSTLVLDISGNGIALARKNRVSAMFDMNGDGIPDDTGWIARGEGFLVIDRNNNGQIDNGSELSFLAEDPTAKTSLAGLAKLDSNGDRLINDSDARFVELKVWVDADQNGRVDLGELKSLTEIGIMSIGLEARNVDQSVKIGNNIILDTATFTWTNGLIGTSADAALAFTPGKLSAIVSEYSTFSTPSILPEGAFVEVEDPLLLTSLPAVAARRLETAIVTFGVEGASGDLTRLEMPSFNTDLAAAPGAVSHVQGIIVG